MLKKVFHPMHPAALMTGFWAVIYTVYFLAPIAQSPVISIKGFIFVCLMIFVFVWAALLGTGRAKNSSPNNSIAEIPSGKFFRHGWLNAFLIVGLVGTLLSILAKISALDLLSLAGSYALRSERAQQLMEGEQITSGALGALGFLFYPAGFVAVVVSILKFEHLPMFTRALAIFYVPAIFLMSIASGGRSAILVTILLIGLSAYIRKCRGLPLIPNSKVLKCILAGLLVSFLMYSAVVWQVRSDAADLDLDGFLLHADQAWEVRPTENLEWFAEAIGDRDLVKSIMNTIFYFTQSLSVIERVLGIENPPILFGGYHIDLVAAALRATPDGQEFLAEAYSTLLDENIYGFFAGSWGALYIDFGLLGCFLVVAVWGWFAGRSYRRIRQDIHNDRVILYIFWMYTILISFVSPPFGFSNSALLFFWFIAYSMCTTLKIRLAAMLR